MLAATVLSFIYLSIFSPVVCTLVPPILHSLHVFFDLPNANFTLQRLSDKWLVIAEIIREAPGVYCWKCQAAEWFQELWQSLSHFNDITTLEV